MIELPPLYLITDGDRLGEPALIERVVAAVRGGVRMVQVREKHLGDDELGRLVGRLRARIPSEVVLILNGRPQLVTPLGAQGVHLAGAPATVTRVRCRYPDIGIVGYSAHEVGELRLALDAGADYTSYSPIFPPSSKASALPPVGLDGLRRACATACGRIYALGGLTARNAADARRNGAAGVAVIGAILDSSDPEAAARSILEAWSAASGPSDRTETE